MLRRARMDRSPALHLAVMALLGFCCLVHASSAAIPFPPAGPRVRQETEEIPASSGADQVRLLSRFYCMFMQDVVAREADPRGVSRRIEMDMELEDYPGSGANDRHSPWRQERRN